MAGRGKKTLDSQIGFGYGLAITQLIELRAEMQTLRSYRPLVKRANGKYEGDILGFVKGLRLSARLIYFLRERLSHTDLEVSWGHLLDTNWAAVSPECDVIVHARGHMREWNGNQHPVMHFKFVEAASAKAVISCKSSLSSIDRDYPKALRRFGVNNVFLFAECCRKSSFDRLNKSAKQAGYKGLWCLYFTGQQEPFIRTDDSMYVDFGTAVQKAVKS